MNYGKMSMVEVPPPEGVPVGMKAFALVDGQGVRWQEIAPPKQDGFWIIAVDGEGLIRTCDADPLSLCMAGMDIWHIEHPGPREDIFTHTWNGSEVIE
jgi:hypothetical protein